MTPTIHRARALVVLAGLATLSIATGCAGPRAIVNHWMHSHEEDTEGVQVYRPSTYAFPPARGREGFDLREDGTAVLSTIAPADGSETSTGRWMLSDEGMLTITSDATARPMRFDVEYGDSALLKLRPMR